MASGSLAATALVQDLRALLRVASGRAAELTAAIIDSRSLRSTRESDPRAGYDGATMWSNVHSLGRHDAGGSSKIAAGRPLAPDKRTAPAARLKRRGDAIYDGEDIASKPTVTIARVERTLHTSLRSSWRIDPGICTNEHQKESVMHRRRFFATTASTALAGSAFAAPHSVSAVASGSSYGNGRLGVTSVTFLGGKSGDWKVQKISAYIGDSLPSVERIAASSEINPAAGEAVWALRGVAGHARYVERREKGPLDAAGPPLGRPEAQLAALIPIRKNPQWWSLPQDERRAIFEERSHHISDSMKYMPRIARKLYHARDLGEAFDFLTWFEFAAEHSAAFDELLVMLRSREEWNYVDREVEIRLER